MRERSIVGVARRERTIGSAGLRFSRNLRCSSLDSFMYFATSLRRSSTPLRLLPLRRAFSISCACPQRASAAERKSTSVGLRRAERSGRVEGPGKIAADEAGDGAAGQPRGGLLRLAMSVVVER